MEGIDLSGASTVMGDGPLDPIAGPSLWGAEDSWAAVAELSRTYMQCGRRHYSEPDQSRRETACDGRMSGGLVMGYT